MSSFSRPQLTLLTESSADLAAAHAVAAQRLGSSFSGGGESWKDQALCAETDPEALFPEKGGSTREAKPVCLGCAVRAECLDYALANDERFGVWGGLSAAGAAAAAAAAAVRAQRLTSRSSSIPVSAGRWTATCSPWPTVLPAGGGAALRHRRWRGGP